MDYKHPSEIIKGITYKDLKDAPVGTTYSAGGVNVTKTDNNTLKDCDAFGVCATHKISGLENMPTWSPWSKIGDLLKRTEFTSGL